MNTNKPASSLAELESEFKALKSYWSEQSLLTTKAVLYLCKLFETPPARLIRRKQSAWQKFFGEQIRDGKTAKEASKSWKKLRKK